MDTNVRNRETDRERDRERHRERHRERDRDRDRDREVYVQSTNLRHMTTHLEVFEHSGAASQPIPNFHKEFPPNGLKSAAHFWVSPHLAHHESLRAPCPCMVCSIHASQSGKTLRNDAISLCHRGQTPPVIDDVHTKLSHSQYNAPPPQFRNLDLDKCP